MLILMSAKPTFYNNDSEIKVVDIDTGNIQIFDFRCGITSLDEIVNSCCNATINREINTSLLRYSLSELKDNFYIPTFRFARINRDLWFEGRVYSLGRSDAALISFDMIYSELHFVFRNVFYVTSYYSVIRDGTLIIKYVSDQVDIRIIGKPCSLNEFLRRHI